MNCATCQTCVCQVCNCRVIEQSREQGFYILPARVLLGNHSRVNIESELQRKCAPLAFIKTVVLSNSDSGNGKTVYIEFVCNIKPSDEELLMLQKSMIEYGEISFHPEIKENLKATKFLRLQLQGLHCGSCVNAIEHALSSIKGIVDISIDLNTQLATIKHVSVPSELIIAKIEAVGFTAEIPFEIVEHSQVKKFITVADVDGMTCASCVKSLENVLLQNSDFSNVTVTLLPQRAILHHTDKTTTNDIVDRIEEVGFHVLSTTTREVSEENKSNITLIVEGMTCASCVNAIESFLVKQPGIFAAQVNLIGGKTSVVFDANLLGPRDIIEMIDSAGYSASLDSEERATTNEVNEYGHAVLVALLYAIPTFLIGMVFMMFLPHSNPISRFLMQHIIPGVSLDDIILWIIATPVQFGLGYRFYRGAWKSVVNLKAANMDVLVSLGTSVAYFFSVYAIIQNAFQGKQETKQFFETSVFLIFFILLGKYMEAFAKGKTSDAIKKLIELTPDTAVLITLEEDQIKKEEIIDLRLIQVGDILKVTPGSRFPCDGVVIKGQSFADESMLTGESLPVFKEMSSNVYGGTVNNSSMLLVKANKVGSDTTISRIIKLVEDAQGNKAPIQQFADYICSIFVPAVLLIAVITFLSWLILFNLSILSPTIIPTGKSVFLFSIEHAIATLVIACPCALGLATPTAVMVASGVAASFGILLKGGGSVLEKANFLKIICFDKTGTLTLGTFTVGEALICDTEYKQDFFNILYELESCSDHPIARAICNGIKDRRSLITNYSRIENVQEIPGQGLKGKLIVGNQEYTVVLGNQTWMSLHNINAQTTTGITWQSIGKTIIYLGIIGKSPQLMGMIEIADQVRPEAVQVISELEKRGVQVWMITGDNDATARAIASQIKIPPNQILSQVLPQQKAEKIKELQLGCLKTGGTVAMVGDGINDSVALAQSDVGIAIGAGSDVAIESAQVVLVKSNLLDILTFYDLATKAYGRIQLNFVWAYGYNLIGIPLACGIFYPAFKLDLAPWMAGLAMAISSVSVIANSLLLRWYRPPSL